MTTEYLGTAKIRKPEYTDPRWDVPQNENWEVLASLIQSANLGYRWVENLDLTDNGGLNITISDGVVFKTVDTTATGATFDLSDGTTSYIYVDYLNQVQIGTTLNIADSLPLYSVTTSGGVITQLGDIRNKLVGGGGGGIVPPEDIKTSDFTAIAAENYPIDCSANHVKVTLPATPVIGDWVTFGDYAGTCGVPYMITVSSVDPLHGVVGDVDIDSANTKVTVQYIDSTVGWQFSSGIGESSASGEAPDPSTGGGTPPPFIIATDFTAIAGQYNYMVDVSAGGVTMTMPSSPSAGDLVFIGDYLGTCGVDNSIYVTSADNIFASADDFRITAQNCCLVWQYVDATVGWKIVDGVGEQDNQSPVNGITSIIEGAWTDAQVVDWATSGYELSDFDEVKIVGWFQGSNSSTRGLAEVTLPPEELLSMGSAVVGFMLPANLGSGSRMTVINIAETSLTVNLSFDDYANSYLKAIYGIKY